MRDFQGRRRVRKMIYSKISILVLVFLVVFMTKALWGVYTKNRLAATGRVQAEGELRDLENQKAELSARVGWMAKARGQEEAIRQNFSVTLPGEKMVIVVEDEQKATTSKIKNNDNWWSVGWRALSQIFD
ncbi:MAG: hypothetical protein QG665_148 [Patescibacteria group bacterium]|nr:hypothetical protein [Patescibacteria group bacterium]